MPSQFKLVMGLFSPLPLNKKTVASFILLIPLSRLSKEFLFSLFSLSFFYETFQFLLFLTFTSSLLYVRTSTFFSHCLREKNFDFSRIFIVHLHSFLSIRLLEVLVFSMNIL